MVKWRRCLTRQDLIGGITQKSLEAVHDRARAGEDPQVDGRMPLREKC